jgi:two-component system, OmpR family, sensor kinase
VISGRADAERLAFTVHEVRSPVAALAAVAEAVEAASSDAEALQRLVALAVAACRAIERLLDEAVLDVVLLEGVDVGRIAGDATASAALQGARVRLEVAPEVGPVAADPVRLRQALDNFIRNALLYGAPGGEIAVRVHPGDGGRTVRFSVSNDGAGIPAEAQARIFEPGVRLDRARPGSGLGLSVVRAVTEGHGGTVSVDSAPGRGATFTISIPARDRQPATAASRR